MTRTLTICFAMLVLLTTASQSVWARKNEGHIQSIAKVNTEEQIYRVNIQRINGRQPPTHQSYAVDPGQATIRVSLILEAQWAPKLKRIQNDIFSQEFKMNIEPGATYLIGGKVNPDASHEEQDAGTFWHPTVIKESEG